MQRTPWAVAFACCNAGKSLCAPNAKAPKVGITYSKPRLLTVKEYANNAINVIPITSIIKRGLPAIKVLPAEAFLKEIAPARTFVQAEEIDSLLGAGLGKGANKENTVVLGGDQGGEMRMGCLCSPLPVYGDRLIAIGL